MLSNYVIALLIISCEPTTLLPHPRSIATCTPCFRRFHTSKKLMNSLKINWFHDPSIKARFNVSLSVLFQERGRYREDWYIIMAQIGLYLVLSNHLGSG